MLYYRQLKLNQLKQFTSKFLSHHPCSTNSTSFSPNKLTPKQNCRNILITAALPYINNTPHLGNIIGAILSADCYARYCRMRGYNTLFISGTDDYGTTTQIRSKIQKKIPQEICQKYHQIHKDIYHWFQIQFDYFGRTTQPIHTEITQHIFNAVYRNNFIHNENVQLFYCSSCQMTLADRYVIGICNKCGANAKGDQCQSCSNIFKNPITELKSPKCSICSSTPKIINSKHFYLNLSKCQQKLTKWLIKQNGMKNWSHNAKAVTKAWLDGGLQDRCITRDLKWGVQVPQQYQQQLEGNKVFYVWFEAPIGYISITAALIGDNWKQWWQPASNIKVQLNQFMGKDNIAFHSVLHPATLQCTGQPYIKPFRLSVTQHLMFEGKKFSKSNNIGIFGDDCQKTGIKSDVWRFALLSNRPQTLDSQFTWQQMLSINKSYLVNTLGNLCNRILKYVSQSLSASVPKLTSNNYTNLQRNLIKNFTLLIKKYCQHLQNVELRTGAQVLIQMGQIFNKYLQDSEFWSTNNKAKGRDKDVMAISIRILEYLAILIKPYLPETSTTLLEILALNQYDITQFAKKQSPSQQFQLNFTNQYQIQHSNSKWKNVKIDKILLLFTQIQSKSINEIKNKIRKDKVK